MLLTYCKVIGMKKNIPQIVNHLLKLKDEPMVEYFEWLLVKEVSSLNRKDNWPLACLDPETYQ